MKIRNIVIVAMMLLSITSVRAMQPVESGEADYEKLTNWNMYVMTDLQRRQCVQALKGTAFEKSADMCLKAYMGLSEQLRNFLFNVNDYSPHYLRKGLRNLSDDDRVIALRIIDSMPSALEIKNKMKIKKLKRARAAACQPQAPRTSVMHDPNDGDMSDLDLNDNP